MSRDMGGLGDLDQSVTAEQDEEDVHAEQKSGSGVAQVSEEASTQAEGQQLRWEMGCTVALMKQVSMLRVRSARLLAIREGSCRYEKRENWSGLRDIRLKLEISV